MLRCRLLLFKLCPAAAAYHGKNLVTTNRLWDRIEAVNSREQKPNTAQFLRLQITSGGCQGFQYEFLFEPAEKHDAEDDIVFRKGDEKRWGVSPGGCDADVAEAPNGLPTLVVDKITLTKLVGATIDYHSELKGSAFVVVGNELVDQSCACAQSFSMRKKT
jgi:Fe-S cluster assembly iron-binding protein IscA